MAKHALFIIGNIASGKSSAISQLHLLMPQYAVFSTDEIRRQAGENPIAENDVTNLIIQKIETVSNAIIELTGVGQNFATIKARLRSLGFKIKVILIACSPSLCMHRYHARKQAGYSAFAMYKHKSIKETIDANYEKLQHINIDGSFDSAVYSPSEIAKIIHFVAHD